jgi:hypothetical protein
MTTHASQPTATAASGRERPAGSLRSIWDIGEESFRTLINARYRPVPAVNVTDDERSQPMLGDPLLVVSMRRRMRAVDIAAGADAVWPWLAQMMRGGGIYGWPALETNRCRSADYLLEVLAPPRVGDRLGDVLQVADVEPNREIVWHAPAGFELLGFQVQALTVDYRIEPGAAGRCRLVARLGALCEQLTSQVRGYLGEVVDFLLPAFQLDTIRRHVESYSQREAAGAVNRDTVGRHQALLLRPGPHAAISAARR